MSYKIFYGEDSQKQLDALDKSIKIQVLKKIAQLENSPELGEPLSNVLKNKRRLHVGKFRVIYLISDNDVIISRIGHRKDVYK